MRHVSREDGGPRKSSVAMEQPATTNSTPTKKTLTPTAEIMAVPLLQALLYRQRDELAIERAAVKALQRARAAEIKAVREEEAMKCRNLLSDLKSRLERDHEDALQRQKDAITKTLNSEMHRTLNEKDAEMRRHLAEAREREEMLKLQVRDAVRAGRDVTGCQQTGAYSGTIQKLQQEATALRSLNKQLEERLEMVAQADRQKVCDLRSQQVEHEKQLEQLKKTWQQETNRLLEEIKSKDRIVSQLEQQLNLQKGRIQERGEQWAETDGERHQHEHCECAKLNCGEVLAGCLEFQQSSMKEAVETEVVSDPGGQVDELETLRAELEERDRIIAELQQGERLQDKNQKPDHLSDRHRKEQMRQYYRHFMELEPVAELEEDSGAGEDSPTSSISPSLSPQPYTANMWAEVPDKQYHDTLYSCLLKEHLELQREYQFLQNRLQRVLAEANRTRLKLEHELAAAVTNVRKLQRLLAEQEGAAVVLTDRISQLQAETQDLREQNELLEFRILELEECHDNSSVRSHWPDTRDVWTDTESDDVSDSGVQSLPSSDSDAGIHDMKLDILSEELKGRLQDLIQATPNTADRSCLQQVLALLKSCECRPQDSVTAGRGIRSSSESNRIIATVLPFTDKSVDGEGDNIKKHLKNSECMQESGIFEETEYTSQGTQTGDLNLEALIWDIRMPFETGVVGELNAEIQRLNQFRERVEEAGHCCGNKKLLRVDEDLPSQSKELDYCRQRLQVLEDKVRIYESSGDLQARLLAERLQKEVSLSAQVKQLSARVQQLISKNRCLEEEKCEMEEAENDTRLRCQKLEVKLVTLSESKADLESQLQQERRSLGRLRSALSKCERQEEESRRNLNYLEVMLNKYEQRNYDLEEREVDLRHRLEMLEVSIPALVIWNMWRIVQNKRISRTDATSAAMSRCLLKVTNAEHRCGGLGRPNTELESSVTVCPPCPSTLDSSTFQDVEDQGHRIETDLIGSEEVCRPIEEGIRFQLQDLEAEVVLLKAEIRLCKESEEKYRQRISELEGELFDINSGSQVDGSETMDSAAEAELTQNEMTDVQHRRCTKLECVVKAQEFAESEASLKKRIVELELKERAYMETIQRADELWSDMETSYKRRISDSEVNDAEMRQTIKKLQESEAKLRQAYRQDDENEMLLEKIQIVEENEKMLAERVRSLETEKNQLAEEINQLRDTLYSEQKELEKTKKMVARPLKEELLKERKLSRSLQDEIRILETDSQHRSRDQEAQINGLKVQLSKMSRDLVDLECTNGELKEEVETLEAKVCELRSAIEEQKQNEEKLAIRMSQTIQRREQELEEIKREMRFSLTPTAHDELREVDKGVVGKNATGTHAAPTPAGSELSDVPSSQTGKNASKTPAANISALELNSQAPGTAEEVTQLPPEVPPRRERGLKCSRGVEQPLPVSTLTQKPVLRRWLLSQTVQRQDCSHWRQC